MCFRYFVPVKSKERKNSMETQSTPEEELFFTAIEVAKVLGRSAASVRILFASGKLPCKRIGGRWLMHRRDFESLKQPPEPVESSQSSAA